MGCITGIGRIILIILNMVMLVVSLAVLAVGVLLKFYTSEVTKIALGTVSALDKTTRDNFNIPDLEDITELPFVNDIGMVLLIFGAVLFAVSFFACCGACYQWRPLLILFVIVMSLMVIAQGVVGGLFLAKDSILHSTIKDEVGDKVKNDFQKDGDDVFSFAINMLNYLLECCGIRDKNDFPENRPPSCCSKEIIESGSAIQQDQCTRQPPTAPESSYNQQGCYPLLHDKVLSNLVLAAVVLAGILLLQVVEIIFAILIVKDVTDQNTKVGPH